MTTTTQTYTPTDPRSTGVCGHHACAGSTACTYWPGTLTPVADVRVDWHVDDCPVCTGGLS